MDRHMEVLVLAVLERNEMVVGREPVLGSGDVEANHALIVVADCGAGNLKSVIEMAHSRADHPDGEVGSCRTGGEANEHGFDDLVKAETLLGVEFGREPDLGIDERRRRRGLRRTHGQPARSTLRSASP